MTVSGGVRDHQREASEAAILDAAWDLFARCGPDGASLRDVGASAGFTHALVARYYGSKDGLVGAVASRLAVRTARVVDHAAATADDPVLDLLGTARSHRTCMQLLVRSALGDLPPREFPACLRVDWLLSQATTAPTSPTGHLGPDRRARLCAYAAACLVLGFVTFEGFLVAATRSGAAAGRPPRRRRRRRGAAPPRPCRCARAPARSSRPLGGTPAHRDHPGPSGDGT